MEICKKNLEFSRNEILAGDCVNDYAWKIDGSNISSNGFMVHLLFLQKLSLISETSYVTIFDRHFFRRHKGRCQKLLSGFFPLRGGYPPFPLRVFGQDDFPLRGEGGTPQFC